ncbi:MAG: hypothetical protein ABIN18_00920 [Pseudomonadota bacterium]
MQIKSKREEGEQLVTEHTSEVLESRPKQEQNRMPEIEITSVKNLNAKKAMAQELEALGLSNEAIERLLHMELNVKGARRKV